MRRPNGAYYVYPFPSKATTTGRTDQGVDLGGSGPVVAIGRARILKTHSPWPEYEGGAGILYQLLEGPDKGRTVYVYEGVKANVRAGQIVAAGQRIGTIIPGTSSGIETGWADPHTGQPTSHREWESDPSQTPTRAGDAFKSFIGSLGKTGYEKSLIAQGKSPKEAAAIAGEGGKAGLGLPGEKAFEENVPNPVEAIASGVDLTKAVIGALENPETLLLNVALVGGGAFLVYYGAALLLGVHKPVGAPVKAVAP